MTRRAIASVFAVAVAGACASFDEGKETTPSPAVDGSADVVADVATDASSEASTSSDAGTQSFSDNFDQGVLGAKWFDKNIAAPVTMELAGGQGVSPPNALLVRFPDHDGIAPAYDGWLLHRFNGATKSLTCRVKMFIETLPANTQPSILDVQYRAAERNEVDFNITDSASSLAISQEGIATKFPSTGTKLEPGKWLSLAMTIDSDTRDIEIRLEDKVYFGGRFDNPARPNDGFDIRLGAFNVRGGAETMLRYDDFSCDVVLGP